MTSDNLRSSASFPRLVERGWATRKPVQFVRNGQIGSLGQREARLATEGVPKFFKKPIRKIFLGRLKIFQTRHPMNWQAKSSDTIEL